LSKRQRRTKDKRRRHERLASTKRQFAVGGGLALAASLVTGSTAQATDFTVNSLNNAGDNTCDTAPGGCTLRDAIDDANNLGGPDRVLFQSGLSGSIDITSTISITDEVEVLGPGASVISVDANENARIFLINSPGESIAISGLTLTDGNTGGVGGAIINTGAAAGVLTVSNSTLTSNAAYYGGAIAGQATISNSTLSDNTAKYKGGAIASPDLTISGSSLTGNYATAPLPADNYGGAIYAYGPLAINSTTISGNYAKTGGGAIAAFYDGPVDISDSTLSGNTAATGYGGGVYLSDGSLTISDSTLSENTAASLYGGAIFTNGDTSIQRSTLSENYAYEDGGAVYSSAFAPGDLTIENSTIYMNTVLDHGGGVWYCCGENEQMTVRNSTITNNYAAAEGGGMQVFNDNSPGYAQVYNTIVANNSSPLDPDISGGTFNITPVDAAFTIVETPTDPLTETVPGSNILGVDPQLGALAPNGGPTETQALPQASPAVDKGSSFGAGTDQRGSPRPVDGATIPNSTAAGADGADIGAFEIASLPAAPPSAKCKGKTATVFRPGLSRTLTGTNKRDVIVGTAKKDKINARGGNDLVCAKGGKDTVLGKGGKDKLFGQGGKDTLKGGAGKDTLKGGGRKDRLFGQGGKDRLFGQGGKDRLVGGAKADKLVGGAKDDTCIGGAGRDTEKSC
jgi:predicted outer membrane repeat protein